MTLFDLFKLIRHYIKLVIILPVACAILVTLGLLVMPPTYVAKATLLTNGDIALAGGFAQTEATTFSKNGIEVSSKNVLLIERLLLKQKAKTMVVALLLPMQRCLQRQTITVVPIIKFL